MKLGDHYETASGAIVTVTSYLTSTHAYVVTTAGETSYLVNEDGTYRMLEHGPHPLHLKRRIG